MVQETETVELQCLVSGKPKPIILWSRADREMAMPDGSMQMESYDGILRIVNVSRDMSGTYRCQTSQYNGFNVKPREAVIELIVQCESPIFSYFLWDCLNLIKIFGIEHPVLYSVFNKFKSEVF